MFISGILASLTSATIAQISKTKKLCVDVLAVLCDRVSCFNFVRCEVFFSRCVVLIECDVVSVV